VLLEGVHWTRPGGEGKKTIVYLWPAIKRWLDTGDALKGQKQMRRVK